MGGVGEWEWEVWVRVDVCGRGPLYMCTCVCLCMCTCVCVSVHVYMCVCVFVHVLAYHCLDVLGTLCIFKSVAGLLEGRARWADVCNHGSAAVATEGVLQMGGGAEQRVCDRDSRYSELKYFMETATEGGG